MRIHNRKADRRSRSLVGITRADVDINATAAPSPSILGRCFRGHKHDQGKGDGADKNSQGLSHRQAPTAKVREAGTTSPSLREPTNASAAVHVPAVHVPAVHVPAVHVPAAHVPAAHVRAVHVPAGVDASVAVPVVICARAVASAIVTPDTDTAIVTPDTDTIIATPDTDTAIVTPDTDTAIVTPDTATAIVTPDTATTPDTADDRQALRYREWHRLSGRAQRLPVPTPIQDMWRVECLQGQSPQLAWSS